MTWERKTGRTEYLRTRREQRTRDPRAHGQADHAHPINRRSGMRKLKNKKGETR